MCISLIEKEIALWKDLTRRHDDMEVLFEFADSGETELKEIQTELDAYEQIIDKVNHVLVPKHTLINIDDHQEILDKYDLDTKYKLPVILKTDPIAKYYAAQRGDIFKIERNSITSGKYILYRCVV